MKLLIPLVIAAGLGLTLAHSGPSENGLENGQRNGWEKREVYPVPDGGSTLVLLGIGMAGLALWRIKLA